MKTLRNTHYALHTKTTLTKRLSPSYADGIIVEARQKPSEALSNGAQSLKPKRFATLVQQINAIARVLKEEEISTNPLQ